MKIEKEFLIFKRLLDRNRARPTRTVCTRPTAAQPQRRNAWPGSRGVQPARRGPAASSCGPRASEARPGAAPAQRSRARDDGGTRTQSGLRGERLWHEPW
jgi:hypothetical protein